MTQGDPTSPVQPGDLVAGKYRVERVLGAGGMGVVVAALHEQLDQRVALKFLLPSVLFRPDIVQRFLREARAAVRIQSEHVARVLDVGTMESGAPYMIMEYLDGQDLAQVLESRGQLPPQEAVGYLLETCEAVAEAHALGIVHRDLKPGNLFLARRPSGKPTIKVLDFGISKVPTPAQGDAVTKTSTVMGSPGYMSPEQMVAVKSVDARSDIWSLGVVLYEMFAQRLPFLADTMPELVAAILQRPPDPIGQLRPDLPVGLQAVVERCLQKEPSARYSNVAELARALVPFGPPHAELSVERIEHVLGVSRLASGTIIEPSGGVARSDPATLLPTTTFASRQRATLFVVPGILLTGGVIVAVFFALRHGHAGTNLSSGGASQAVSPPALSDSSDLPDPILEPAAVSSVELAPPVASASTTVAAPPPAHAVAVAPRAPSSVEPPAPSHAPSASPPGPCKMVAYFDDNGTRHYRKDCSP